MPEVRAIQRVTVALDDGVERPLRYTLRAMKEAREEFGGSITDQSVLNRLDETTIGKLLWYGLKTDDPAITVEYIEDHIDPTMLKYLFERYAVALGAALPNAQSPAVEETNRAKVTAISTGSTSGVSEDTASDLANGISGTAHLQSLTRYASD